MSRKNGKEEEEYIPKAFRKKKNSETNQEMKKKKKGKKSKKKKSKFRKIILGIILIFIVGIGIQLGISTHHWKRLAKEMFHYENSIVVDIDGKEIAKLGCERKNKIISSEEIPIHLKNAYIAIEDERFYTHKGVDIKRTGGAILSYITHFGKSSYGGSTITQQLVKNLTGDSTDSIVRKVKEWWKAYQLETCLSKDEVLTAYLNIIYVGPNMYGVETASQYYFSKSAKDLSLEECAFLAGMNHSPNSYNPFEEKDNQEKIQKRTKTVLTKMLELNYINQEEYNIAMHQIENNLPFKQGKLETKEAVYSYHTDALILEVVEDLAKKYGISKNFATNYINMAGLTIHSTQDSKVQKQAEIEFEKSRYKIPSKIGEDSSQAAMVIIDHSTGKVVGCIGGLGKKTKARSLNRATQSVRQTGSAIKPLAVLVPGIDKKIVTASSIYDDTERDFADGYHPTDYNEIALGKITVRRAIESSQNIPFVEMMEKIKPKTAMEYLKKMGIHTITQEDETLVLALGGLQKGISPLEMAGAYAMLANDGQYIEPTFYTKINNKLGITILKTVQKKRRVIAKEVAYVIKEILTEPVNGKHGTATYCKISGVEVAAKTGTTDENYDRWLCGFTPYYTAVTWYGYDKNETIEFNNRNPAGLLWANVMSKIHGGLNNANFKKPEDILDCSICPETGKRATSECKNAYIEYFLKNTLPELCDQHKGRELEKNKEKTNQTKIEKTIEDNPQDIDVEDPQQILNKPITENRNQEGRGLNNTNSNITNSMNNENTSKNIDTTKDNTKFSNTNHTTQNISTRENTDGVDKEKNVNSN